MSILLVKTNLILPQEEYDKELKRIEEQSNKGIILSNPKFTIEVIPEIRSITKQIEEITENICDNFCKYRDTCDENCECEWIRDSHDCPLDKLI